jgi:hypothetical protein
MLIGVMNPQDRTSPILAKTEKASMFIIVLFELIYDGSIRYLSKVHGQELKRIIKLGNTRDLQSPVDDIVFGKLG